MPKGSVTLPVTSIITIDSSITNLPVFQCCYKTPTKQPTTWQTTDVHMVTEQVGYEGNGQKRGEEITLGHTEAYDKEEIYKIQACTRVTILRMTGKKTFHNTDQNPKLEE